jgi:hypothetical protein
MAGLQAGTILLLSLWTLWLLIALPLLGRERGGAGLLLVFVPLALVLAFTTHVSWRGYLMAWLAAHLALAAAVVIAEEDRRQIWAAAVSLGALLWLWGEGGWQYGRYIAIAMVLLVAAAALAGLGLGCCWLFAVHPLRRQAAAAARQAVDAEHSRADAERSIADARCSLANAKRSLARKDALLAAEQKKYQTAQADSIRQIEALEKSQQLQLERYEQDRRSWERTRQKLRVALQEARRGPDPQFSEDSSAERPQDTGNGTSGLAGADEVTVIRLRFSYVAEHPRFSFSSPGMPPYQPSAADPIRLIIEQSITTMPRDQAGGIDEVLGLGRQARDDATTQERFIDAASEYAGDRIGNDMSHVLTQRWETQDPAHVDAVVQVLNRCDERLHDLAGKPFEEASRTMGLPEPGAAALGGIGSNLVLAPVSREIQGAVRFCEIVGIGIGLVFGLHPLAISCTKSLLRSQLNQRLSTAVKDVFCDREAYTADRDPPSAEPARLARPSAAELTRPWEPVGPARTGPVGTPYEPPARLERGATRGPVDRPASGIGRAF